MPTKSPRNTPIGPLDGIRRTPRRPPSATPKTGAIPITFAGHHPPVERPLPHGLVMGHGQKPPLNRPEPTHHPVTNDIVSHPSLPSPHARQSSHSRHKSSMFRQVISSSFRVAHDRRSTRAVLIATMISPTFWLFLAAPWLIAAVLQPGSTGSRAIMAANKRLLDLSFVGISGRLLLLSLGLFLIWVGRHALLLVSHAVHVRQIDHRLSDSHAFWWSAVHKLSRSFSLASFDIALTGAILAAIVAVTLWVGGNHPSTNLLHEGLALNAVVLIATLLAVILSVHRPLARVMLATTDLSLWQLIRYSFGMIIYNFGRSLLMGLWWVLLGILTLGLLIGIGWATLSYAANTPQGALIGKLLLGILTIILTYGVLAVFLLWSQGYWSLAYHYLAHRTYPAQVSRFFTTTPHTSRRRFSLLRVALVTVALGIVAIVTVFVSRGPLERQWQRAQSFQPTIQEWLGQR